MTRAFVAGATGYTGREVVRALVARGVATSAHVRPDSSRLEEWRLRFDFDGADVDSTPWQPDAMTATLRRLRPDVVFALLGTTRSRARTDAAAGRDSSYEAVDYGLTVMLLRAALSAGHRPRFVYLSALGAGRPRGEYMQARARVEAEVVGSGLPHIIARPSLITGPDREELRPLERVLGTAFDGVLRAAAALGARAFADRWRSISAQRLATALVRLALDPAATGVYGADALQATADVA